MGHSTSNFAATWREGIEAAMADVGIFAELSERRVIKRRGRRVRPRLTRRAPVRTTRAR